MGMQTLLLESKKEINKDGHAQIKRFNNVGGWKTTGFQYI